MKLNRFYLLLSLFCVLVWMYVVSWRINELNRRLSDLENEAPTTDVTPAIYHTNFYRP